MPRFQKNTQDSSAWSEIVGLASTTLGLFVAAYIIMNGPALGQVVAAKISPFDTGHIAEQMSQVGNSQIAKMPPLLPTAGQTEQNNIDIPSLQVEIAPLDNRIVIPRIGKNIPLVRVPTTNLINENRRLIQKGRGLLVSLQGGNH